MRPAFSVILLTTLIGAGQGLFLALFSAESYAAFGLLGVQPASFYAQGSAIAALLLLGGLAASFFHLGRPERAWRAAAQWRTSWLAREVIVLPSFLALVVLYGVVHFSGVNPVLGTLPSGAPISLSAVVGAAGSAFAFVLFLCTAMIYAGLRFLREWHTPLTVINYLLLGSASGFTLAAALAAAWAPSATGYFAGWAVILTAAAFVGRSASLVRNAHLKRRSTLQTAIGVKHPRIVQKASGALGGSFNTREFFHDKPIARLRAVKNGFLAFGFVLPLALLGLGLGGVTSALAFAFIAQFSGLLAERWFFFAQVDHPQNLYYACIS